MSHNTIINCNASPTVVLSLQNEENPKDMTSIIWLTNNVKKSDFVPVTNGTNGKTYLVAEGKNLDADDLDTNTHHYPIIMAPTTSVGTKVIIWSEVVPDNLSIIMRQLTGQPISFNPKKYFS